ncbi:MAG: phenylalanine--tRNA ligase subunit alpha [Alphaproteobacteria bacterium]|nr:phenylalanine--tRNA ligase subunit alpha [Alphaproteobacteria bacterium]
MSANFENDQTDLGDTTTETTLKHAQSIAFALDGVLENSLVACTTAEQLKQLRATYLGKKGVIAGQFAALRTLGPEQKKTEGDAINKRRDALEGVFDHQGRAIAERVQREQYAAERLDLSLDLAAPVAGGIHPLTRVGEEVHAILSAMGFARREGPDIETDDLNFVALNFPPDHPARAMHDTFYLDLFPAVGQGRVPSTNTTKVPSNSTSSDKEQASAPPMPTADKHLPYLLRTHTSPVQVRTLRNEQLPIRVFAPGRTYRCDSDQTHAPMFHQIEGIVIDKHTHFGHLKGALATFLQLFFGLDHAVEMRFRPSYFPFTEPSAEVDIRMHRDKGRIVVGEGDEWLEILGCGMVHPNVLKAANIDPDTYQGYAFGMGIERLTMLKYGMPDLRTFFEGNLGWLRQNNFVAAYPSPYNDSGGLTDIRLRARQLMYPHADGTSADDTSAGDTRADDTSPGVTNAGDTSAGDTTPARAEAEGNPR